jgi:hypothetical protein
MFSSNKAQFRSQLSNCALLGSNFLVVFQPNAQNWSIFFQASHSVKLVVLWWLLSYGAFFLLMCPTHHILSVVHVH